MEFPITVNKIEQQKAVSFFSSGAWVGKFVSIRPCSDNPDNLTFLGLYVGDLPLSVYIDYKEEEQLLTVSQGFTNPAIFVFDLNKIVYGAESWWGTIDTEDDLRKISDADIDDIWYVKAMRAMAEENKNE